MPARSQLYRIAVLILAAFASCGPMPSGDAKRLEEVRSKHSARYELSIYDDLYLHARARPGVQVDSAEAEQIFRDFFVPPLPPRESNAVYLNLYDHRDKFLYQLSYDPISHQLIRSRAEAY